MADGAGEGSSRPSAGFTQEQINTLTALIRSLSGQTPAATTPAGSPPPPPPADLSQRDWKAEEVDFFDSGLEEQNDAPIVTVGRHSFYRDVYAYVDRPKHLAKQRSPDKLRTIPS